MEVNEKQGSAQRDAVGNQGAAGPELQDQEEAREASPGSLLNCGGSGRASQTPRVCSTLRCSWAGCSVARLVGSVCSQ